MDEILASIRRIISEDDAPAEGAAPATAAAAPVPATAATPAPAPAPAPEVPVQHSKKDLPVKEQKPAPAPEEDVLELTERADAPVPAAAAPAPAPEPAPAPVAAAPAAPARVPDIDGSDIVGKEAAMASTTNFAQLAQATSPKGLPLGHMQQTLEELVKELLRPHLREWMDRNLPPLVERLVRAEIERIAREAEKAVD